MLPDRRYVLLLLLCLSSVGCVRRRMTVRSDPPGALVFIDGQEIGRTPVATPFTYYGTRNFRLVKDGFETISVNQPFRAPWYQVPPLDFFSENVAPQEIRDERVVEFQLVPQANVSMNDVLIHADQLRGEVMPASAMQPAITTPVDDRAIAAPPSEQNVAPANDGFGDWQIEPR